MTKILLGNGLLYNFPAEKKKKIIIVMENNFDNMSIGRKYIVKLASRTYFNFLYRI